MDGFCGVESLTETQHWVRRPNSGVACRHAGLRVKGPEGVLSTLTAMTAVTVHGVPVAYGVCRGAYACPSFLPSGLHRLSATVNYSLVSISDSLFY